MARPTEAEIIKFETEHIILLINLVVANTLWLSLPGKNGFDPKDRKTPDGIRRYNAWEKMGKQIATSLTKWKLTQDKLEKAPNNAVPKVNPQMYTWFLSKANKQKLNDYVLKQFVKEGTAGKGLGFIPLLIWGVIALVGFLSAAYVIDETTTTTQEKEKLLLTTKETLKELNIPPDQAAKIISDTQEQASKNSGLLNSITGGGSGLLLPAILVAAFLLISKNKSSAKAAA